MSLVVGLAVRINAMLQAGFCTVLKYSSRFTLDSIHAANFKPICQQTIFFRNRCAASQNKNSCHGKDNANNYFHDAFLILNESGIASRRSQLRAWEFSFDSLYFSSSNTGKTLEPVDKNRNELLHKSAENWSVSGAIIDQDFTRYMADQVMPYYAKDFVRKNQAHIDESLISKKEVTPTSWSDWAIALLVFPGSVLLLFLMIVLLV